MNRWQLRLVVGTALLVLTACVTQNQQPPRSSDKQQRAADPERAAELNLALGVDYLRKGNLADAKEKIDRALEQNPRNTQVQTTAGVLYERLNDLKKANFHYERALALEPKNPELQNNYAQSLCRQGRFEKGEKLALEAAADPLYKTPEAALLNAGNCALSANNKEAAEKHYRKALQVRPRFTAALFQMATIECDRGNFLPARAFFERYQAAARSTASSLWLGVRIERGLGNTNAANGYAGRLKSEFPNAPETKELLQSERSP
jgi:type IV pilus assembly protein PilF